MKSIIRFLSGFLLLAMVCGALVFAGFIYDTGNTFNENTNSAQDVYFFQPDDNATRRPGVPVLDTVLGASKMRDRLIAKYITEYFYVTPDMTEVTRRKEGDTALKRMSASGVFDTWLKNIAPEIEALAKSRALRIVSLLSVTADTNDGYWVVEYELKTWHTPNNFDVAPEITRGTIYLSIFYEPGMRDTVGGESVTEWLETGGDPAVAFRFGVIDVASYQ